MLYFNVSGTYTVPLKIRLPTDFLPPQPYSLMPNSDFLLLLDQRQTRHHLHLTMSTILIMKASNKYNTTESI